MNNLIHLNPLDPIFNEYEAFVDKSAGLKTIAFKYFGADIQKAIEYFSKQPCHCRPGSWLSGELVVWSPGRPRARNSNILPLCAR